MSGAHGASADADRAFAATPSSPSVSPVPASIPSAKRSLVELRAQPKPRTVAELEALSEWYFGARLHLNYLRVWGETSQYEVAEVYNTYNGPGWLHTSHCCRGYDYSRDFWGHVIGELYCSGTAARSYGQARHKPKDHERLVALAADIASGIETEGGDAKQAPSRSDESPTGAAGDAQS